jgi:hypothetical protein
MILCVVGGAGGVGNGGETLGLGVGLCGRFHEVYH